ncbi:hypothetical protein ANANG_G00142890 [Anguilla anguilla]|uniref:Zinc finger piccolo-type domain-containing protein n=1 Tax=Anguilla anguilla TaxID=7936 RepID=A0A9D3MEG7_ANGAN|nr:hypothetical protein ANANG_G00142890 [Anguilla anguilla]
MGNEASLEGGEGGLSGLPEGIVSDGKGGFIQIPAGTEADLSKLSEEERKQIAAVMSRAQTKPPGNAKDAPTQRTSEVDAIHQPRQPGKPPTQGAPGLSKSRTVDAFRTGPTARQAPPGRSPSSLSLLESFSRQEAKEETRSGMFSSNFLSGANPLSAVSSAVNKFSLFGDEEPEEEKKQKAATQQVGKLAGQQSGPAKAPPQQQQGPLKQGQGPPQQGPGKPGPTQQPGPQGPLQKMAPKGGPQQQGPAKPGPQQQQGPTKPGPQQQGLAKPGPQQQGLAKPGPQQQGLAKPGPQQQGLAKPEPQQQQGPSKPDLCREGPPGAGAQSAGSAKSGAPIEGSGISGPKQSQGPSPKAAGQKSTCPLCKTTELTLHSKEQPNYNTCTQCKTIVCSLCGFSPPDSAGKEWLCLNCQMQRALGDAPAPPKMKPQPQPSKQPSAPDSPQKKQATPEAQGHASEVAKPSEAKKPSPLKKQQTLSDKGKPGTPPSTPPAARKGPVQTPEKGTGPQEAHKPSGTQRPPDQPGPTGTKLDVTGPKSAGPAPHTQAAQQTSLKPTQQEERQPLDQKPSGGAVKTDPKAGQIVQEPGKSQQQMPKGGAGPSPAKTGPPAQAQPPPQPPKQESSFFGLSFGGFSEPPKPQPTTPQATESVSGKLFGFGGFSEAPKQPTPAPPTDSVSGKMFGFSSSIFSSASSLITSAVQDEAPAQSPAQPPATSKEPTPAQPSPKKPPPSEVKPLAGQKPDQPQQAKATPPTQDKKATPMKAEKPPAEPPKTAEPSHPPSKAATTNCPLCKVELNVGSKDPPNYNTCTECKKTVCNLCGFNPMPHLNEKEWLCLNCQTQRALAGQLGDMPPPMPAPTKQPAPTKIQASPVKQSVVQSAEPVISEPSPPKPAPIEQNTVKAEPAAPASPAIAPKPTTSSPAKQPTRSATDDQTPLQEPADMARTVEIIEEAKKAETVIEKAKMEPAEETKEKADNKSGTSGSSEVITAPKKERKKLHVLPEGRQRYDSVEDSSESEPSPLLQRRRKISAASTSSEEYKQDSPGSGDEEDFIRKQIMEMSADEDASEDEDDYVRKQIKEEEQKREQDDKKGKCKSTSGKSKRLLKKSSVSHEPEPGRRHSWQDSDEQQCEDSPDSKKREIKSQEGEDPSTESGGGLRRFKTIELNNTTASPYNAGAPVRQGTEEGELEMESLTDSPEDRSRGESSSLHASSFTPGTSPTSVSSFDEDSDSSPSHKRTSGEGKQHRKARHRQHGQVLPTIEDSSEEDEMREEEELLREQEKQREVDQQQVKKSSGKKSKKDKEELRAQRRREHPKTPPSNLSPIEDASPTEELRQAAEMEELHKSSCSEYSPSIESEPEGFEIHPDKIIAVQKVYQLPTSVSLYSPTEEQNTEITKDTMDKSLKSADEAYEEMMQNVKTLQVCTRTWHGK